jgi:hypothetical protein
VKVIFKKDDFFIAFFVYNFSYVFSKFQKTNYMKVVFRKDNFHVFFQISTKFLDESCLYKRQLSHVFSNFKKIYMKVIFTKNDFHIIFFEKTHESCLL